MATTLSPPAPPAPPDPAPAPLTPGRWAVLLLAGPLAVLLIAYGVLSVVSLVGRTSYERTVVLEPGGQRLTVRSDSGTVELRPSSDGRIRVESSVSYGLAQPEVIAVADADGTRVEGRCGGFALFNCTVDLVVSVPPGLDVQAHSSADDVVARDVSGALTLSSSAGDVTVDGAAGRLSLRSSAGEVDARRVRSAVVDADSGAGDVRLDFDSAPDDVRATSSAGDVRVGLPVGTGPYAVSARTSAGDTRIDVPTDPAASRRVDARSSAGDVRVVGTP